MQWVKLGRFLTLDQIKKCIRLYPDVDRIEGEVIAPNLAEIEQKLGQKADSRYLAYVVHYAIYRLLGGGN